MFIAIEGGDGVGKSTLCPKLAHLIGGVACKTPPLHYEKSRERIDSNASPNEKYEYYKRGVIETSDYVNEVLRGGESVIVDRYWLTTVVYHELIGVAAKRSDFDGIIEPDLTILLSLDPETQVKRMRKRGLTIRDSQMIHRQESISLAYYRHILVQKVPHVALDSLSLSPDECAYVCANIIRSRQVCVARNGI